MSDWWYLQTKKLWWKEFQESWLYLLLAWIIIVLLAAFLPLTDRGSFASWWYNIHLGAIAIMLFVAICLGVTAYAVEEEYETLTPLLAKPIPENDILATKLGVRLGLLFISMVVLGILELITGIWPIEYGTIDPDMYERWVGGLATIVMGLSLGFYFGKTLGRQTPALGASALVYLVGFIILVISPLSYIFETESAWRYMWLRNILLPAVVAAIAITAAIFAPTGEGGFFSRRRPLITVIALGVYAFVLWSLLSVPKVDIWRRPDHYRKHFTILTGTPEEGLAALIDEYTLRLPWNFSDKPDQIGLEFLKDVDIVRDRESSSRYNWWEDDYLSTRAIDFVGAPRAPQPPLEVQPELVVNQIIALEGYAAGKRSAEWIGRCLELAGGPSATYLQKLFALHLAGVADHPEHMEMIASFLEDPSEGVKIMAALMLVGMDDARGEEILRSLLVLPGHRALLLEFTWNYASSYYWHLDFGPEYRDFMRDLILLEREVNYSRTFHWIGQSWFESHGSLDDADLIRRSLWLELSDRERAETSPADMDILDYLKAWHAPTYRDEFYKSIVQKLEVAEAYLPVIREIPANVRGDNRRMRDSERRAWNRYRDTCFRISRAIREFLDINDDRSTDLWWRAFRATGESTNRWSVYSYYLERMMGGLPGLGEEGFAILRELVSDQKVNFNIRFQAAVMLAYHGFQDYHDEVVTIFETYHDRPGFIGSSLTNPAFYALLKQGHPRYAGYLIEDAWEDFHERWGIRWNYRVAESMVEVTGQNFGWNLKKWKKWWEREGQFLAAGEN